MIVAAGLLVLVGLGLFVAGVLTGVTGLYWACVGVCVIAAVLLYLARRRLRAPAAPAPAAPAPAAPAPAGAAPAGTAEVRSGRHASGDEEPAGPTAAAVPAPAAATDEDDPALPAGPGVPDAAPAERPAAEAPPTTVPAAGATAVSVAQGTAAGSAEPPVEEVEVTDLLLVVDLRDEVLVVDEHPRYHVAGCRVLAGQEAIPLPVDEAKTDGFTPCGSCRPDATLADRVRARRGADGS